MHSNSNAPGHDHDGEHGHQLHDHGHDHESDPDTEYTWRIHHPYGDAEDEVAVEVAPKSGLLPRWRFVAPGSYEGITRWGVGPPNGGQLITDIRNAVQGGPVNLVNGPEVIWMGALEALSARKSAYVVFRGDPPHYLAFGQAEEPEGPPGALEGISFGDHEEHPSEHSHL